MTHLHVFALNTADPDLRHTNLTRALGEKPDLPPLADWLGVETLNTGDIELFPISDLGDMSLSDYITAAFAPDPAIPAATRGKLDALDGSVLLMQRRANDTDFAPGAEATEIAALPLARPDHSADLPPAQVSPTPAPPPAPDRPPEARRGSVVWVLAAIVIVVALLWIIL